MTEMVPTKAGPDHTSLLLHLPHEQLPCSQSSVSTACQHARQELLGDIPFLELRVDRLLVSVSIPRNTYGIAAAVQSDRAK